MRLQKLSVKNFLGLPSFQADFAPVTLICGGNRSGKTSLQNAISFALVGQPCREVTRKKDMHQLVTDGASRGEVVVQWAHDDAGQTMTSARTLPDMKSAGTFPANEGVPYGLDMHLFGSLSLNDRQRALLGLMDIHVTPSNVIERMKTRGISDLEKMNQVATYLHSGFEQAEKEAAAKASECRGMWRSVTSESYGSKKAESWEAPLVALPELPADIQTMKRTKDAMDMQIEEKQKRRYAAKQYKEKAEFRRQKIQQLQAEMADPEPIQEEIDKLIDKLEGTRASKIGIMEELSAARLQQHDGQKMICPNCKSELARRGNKLIPYGKELVDNKMLHNLEESAENHRTQEDHLESKIRAKQSELAKWELTKTRLETLQEEAEQEPPTDDESIDQMEEMLSELLAEKEEIDKQVASYAKAWSEREEAESKTQRAGKFHEEVKTWTKIAESLSPEGIPLEILKDALEPINNMLRACSEATKWPQVAIQEDMHIVMGGRIYHLLSESERWRADAMLSVCLAALTKSGVVILDRMDVLEPGDRGNTMRWLYSYRERLSVVLLATLKEPPEIDMPGFKTVWLN